MNSTLQLVDNNFDQSMENASSGTFNSPIRTGKVMSANLTASKTSVDDLPQRSFLLPRKRQLLNAVQIKNSIKKVQKSVSSDAINSSTNTKIIDNNEHMNNTLQLVDNNFDQSMENASSGTFNSPIRTGKEMSANLTASKTSVDDLPQRSFLLPRKRQLLKAFLIKNSIKKVQQSVSSDAINSSTNTEIIDNNEHMNSTLQLVDNNFDQSMENASSGTFNSPIRTGKVMSANLTASKTSVDDLPQRSFLLPRKRQLLKAVLIKNSIKKVQQSVSSDAINSSTNTKIIDNNEHMNSTLQLVDNNFDQPMENASSSTFNSPIRTGKVMSANLTASKTSVDDLPQRSFLFPRKRQLLNAVQIKNSIKKVQKPIRLRDRKIVAMKEIIKNLKKIKNV
ncbi:unnamed protein product [Aphis gossypii]|uniref:Uncharacterized protein n=1 Tax=Aphis gossypii TaxID=80765 RepID=A0A9P0NK42_APHGO|nr:unnamed protein product [Aphis gossypii]